MSTDLSEVKTAKLKYKWRAELLFWVIVFIATALIILPVQLNTIGFPFLWHNITFLLISLTFFRWIFFWKFTPYERNKWIIALLICIQPLLIFILVRLVSDFQIYIDYSGLYQFLGHHSMETAKALSEYIKTEMLGFGVFAIIASATLFFRLIYQLRVLYKTY